MQEFKNSSHPDTPSVNAISRAINRARKSLRPDDPVDLEFEIDESFKQFLKADIKMQSRRHLIFATEKQLEYLEEAKIYYVDETFKIVKPPFTQLWGIHAYIEYGTTMKQVPLLFVLMSGKSKADYVAVLRTIKKIAPSVAPERFVIDFEVAMWLAAREVFDVDIKGCAFHHTQAVMRRIQKIGLSTRYLSDEGTYIICRKLMSLIYLPLPAVQAEYDQLCCQVPEDDKELLNLFDYYKSTWLLHGIWRMKDVNMFGCPIRTNNDVEGFHHQLNSRAGRKNLQFDLLLQILQERAEMVPLTASLVRRACIYKFQRASTQSFQAHIISLWESYSAGNILPSVMLNDIVSYKNKDNEHLFDVDTTMYGSEFNV